MSSTGALGQQLPYLRRYARALTGSQDLGDAAVRDTLQALLAEVQQDVPTRQELYRLFHRHWSDPSGVNAGGGLVAGLSPRARQALLLTAVEAFTVDQTADILGCTPESITDELAQARDAIAEGLQSRVMIIEDEAIIALHLKSIVEDLGHAMVGVARTRSAAAEMAAVTQPEMILADISLADGSSGIDAVKDILALVDVPIIFITAFPERLLTGERPEPTYLITKPFSPETVAATIGQALLVHREQSAMVHAG